MKRKKKMSERKLQLTRAMAAMNSGDYSNLVFVYRWTFALFNGRRFHCLAGNLDGAYKVFLDEWGRSRIFEVQTITQIPIKSQGYGGPENS